MPAFAQKSGGTLTERADRRHRLRNAIPLGQAGSSARRKSSALHAADPGDASRGVSVYETFCSSCHGPGGRGGARASSIVDATYLALVSDQGLRTIVIAGRPELGAPDWRGNVPGKPMTAEDVSDVVAWLAAQRSQQTPAKLAGGIR